MTSIDYGSVESGLLSLVNSLQHYRVEEIAEITRFIEVGEYGLALQTAFDIAVEEMRPLTDESKALMAHLASEMDIADTLDFSKLPR
jgi:hypothetical protein